MAKVRAVRSAPAVGAGLDELRRLVVGPEQARLERLEERPLPTAETVSAVLPEAVARSAERRPDELAIALEPVVTTTVRTVARKDAEWFGQMLAPTIGAAVRKAVADAIAAMLQRFNEALEQSFSVEAVRWRIEARRTNRPLAEVVLLHTLVYSIDQVFLIHSETGLVLEHVAAEGATAQDPDQVASMLAAIDSFVREAFRPQPAGVHLNQVKVGDLTVWVDRDATLAIAAVVRGVAPVSLGGLLREARERIYLRHQADLALLRSGMTPLSAARPMLEECLRSERRAPKRRAHVWMIAAAILLAGALVVGLVRHRTHLSAEARSLRAYVGALAAEPGIVVTSARWEDGQLRIAGLRDPSAPRPEQVLAGRGLAPVGIELEPFLSLDPRVVERRARRMLEPPPGVMLTLRDGSLRATGVAGRRWVDRARVLAPTLAGVDRFEDDLRTEEAVAALRAAAERLEEIELPFRRGSAEIRAGPMLEGAVARSREVAAAAGDARLDVCIVAKGHTDPTGTEQVNRTLSFERANRAVEALVASGTSADMLRARAAGIRLDAKSEAAARSVAFEVGIGAPCSEER